MSKSFAIVLSFILLPVFALADVHSYFDLRNDSFVSPDFEGSDRPNYQMVGARVLTTSASKESFVVDVSGSVAVGAPIMNYFTANQLYFDSAPTEKSKLIFGRMIHSWSDMDDRWKTGLIQPVFKWNPLSPETQGLTGVFWLQDKGDWEVTLYASPIFLPDQGPSFDLDNGQFVRGNPWFHRPPESIRILSEVVKIDYQFQKPNESQIILQSNYGAQAILHPKDAKYRFEFMHVYKPMNQIVLGYDGFYQIPKSLGVVQLEPATYYHSVTGLQGQIGDEKIRAVYSILYDRPDTDAKFESKWTYPTFDPAFIHSLGFDVGNLKRKLSLGYMRVSGGDVTETGELADPTRPSISMHYPYREAWQVSYFQRFSLPRGQSLEAKMSYKRSPLNEFEILDLNAEYRLSALWSFSAKGSLVAASDLSFENQNEISQFRNNDQVMFGATYAF